jgi:hypothetical protein
MLNERTQVSRLALFTAKQCIVIVQMEMTSTTCVESRQICPTASSLGANSLGLHQLRLPNDFVWSALHNTTGLGEIGSYAHEVDVDIASCLATFVDTPK